RRPSCSALSWISSPLTIAPSENAISSPHKWPTARQSPCASAMPSWLVLPVMWLTAWCSKPRKPTTLTMPATHDRATAPIQTQVGRRIPMAGPSGPAEAAVELQLAEGPAGRVEDRAPELRAAIADPYRLAGGPEAVVFRQMERVDVDHLLSVQLDADVLAIEIQHVWHLRFQRCQLRFQLVHLLPARCPVAADPPGLAAGAGARAGVEHLRGDDRAGDHPGLATAFCGRHAGRSLRGRAGTEQRGNGDRQRWQQQTGAAVHNTSEA